ncbi:hypothetical protein MPNT_50078 [Candidatus Methylacidithermus pantelleriae]|uniref:Uncharacterized protein n=1 Tax=Candidatus Methylacidithermus pantelleriae TaxID=2744239 RepID=A0A8J2BNS4_9BACT|nr:hypothetical protein MPNT_50078 [Candidatus Methylacidithermus pantelleriae]
MTVTVPFPSVWIRVLQPLILFPLESVPWLVASYLSPIVQDRFPHRLVPPGSMKDPQEEPSNRFGAERHACGLFPLARDPRCGIHIDGPLRGNAIETVAPPT